MSAATVQDARLYIDCDDIKEIWERFPGLDPACPGGCVQSGVPVLSADAAPQLAAAYAGLADRLAGLTAPRLADLAAAWDDTAPGAAPSRSDDWAAVADVLAGGLGLGLAVLRQVAWRAPAVFGVAFGVTPGAAFGGARPRRGGRAEREGNPPFLRFVFLPGGGAAGLGLLASSEWPATDALIGAADGRDFAQTLRSYQGLQGDMIAYGAAGSALRAAGILVRSGVGLQPTARLAVPVLTRERLAVVAGPWRVLVSEAAALVSAARAELDEGLEQVFSGEYPPRAEGPAAAGHADYLDAAYAVLADMVYAAWRRAGALAAAGGAREGKAGRGLLPWGGRRPAVRALLLETPAAIWQWLLEGCPDPPGGLSGSGARSSSGVVRQSSTAAAGLCMRAQSLTPDYGPHTTRP
ncbi:MAG: hypothetical protein Q8P31_11835 [Bacillota bacterium]|nr:hypothetical protein [Bacillota bacterium]